MNQRRLSMCTRLHPRSPTCCNAMCISRMPIGTRGKFAGTRGRRGNCGGEGGKNAMGWCSGKVVPR